MTDIYELYQDQFCEYNTIIIDILSNQPLQMDKYDLENKDVLNAIGIHCKEYNKQDALLYFELAIAKGNVYAMNNAGTHHLYTNNIEMAIHYYEMAVANGYKHSLTNLGICYHKIGNVEKSLDCFTNAVSNGNITAMKNLGLYYYQQNEWEKAIYYYAIASCAGEESHIINDMAESHPICVYKVLSNIATLPLYLSKLKQSLASFNKEVIIYNNKIRLFSRFNNIDTCPICLDDDKLQIDLTCGHLICIDCYPHHTKCYLSCS